MKKMTNKEFKSTILIISSFFVGCLIGLLGMHYLLSLGSNHNLTKTINKVEDSVVSIESIDNIDVESTGTGFIYKKGLKKAYILTNEHVIDNSEIEVTNSKGETTYAKVLGKDETLDIAVLEIDSEYAPKAAKLGNSNKVVVGEDIFVISSPLSKKYANTVTKGIVSGINRTVPSDLYSNEGTLFGGIQFDASVNPGSSGGPLFNAKGEVIGICIMKFIREEIEGMAFAIPIDQVKPNLKSLERGKTIEKPELGITMVEVTNTTELKKYNIKLDSDYNKGVVVLEIKEGSNADKHLKKGDLIKQIDKKTILETDDVKEVLQMHNKGETIQIKVIRNKKEKTISITLK